MDPTVKIIVDILGALFSAFGKPIVEAALGHHGYVPRRVEAILGPDDSGHASAAADELRGKQAGNDGAPEPEGGASHRARSEVAFAEAGEASGRGYRFHGFFPAVWGRGHGG